MFGKTGTYYGRVWYFQDITERKRAEEALQTLTRELESRVLQRTAELEQEIVQRKTAEKTVTKSLLEKEVMLREIHHRVKNNLQIITSLIRLQKQQITLRITPARLPHTSSLRMPRIPKRSGW
jgi:C4-dicarboxylate-specific signal transduction histidine kinase